MKTYRILILLGMVLYVASFFLIAVKDLKPSPGDSGIPGYTCAATTLLAPWGSDGLRMLREGPVDYFAILLSGWINPLFLIAAMALLIRPNGRFAGILRIVLLVMFLACWVVFYRAHLRPVAGYFLWTAAMLLVLFSNKMGKSAAPAPRKNLLTTDSISPSLRP